VDAVLIYYAIANAAAWTLEPRERRWSRAFAGLGLLGCVALAFTLSATSILSGAALLASGAFLYAIHRSRASRGM
jgi:APA family basic amino acid/polyamine antiporter